MLTDYLLKQVNPKYSTSDTLKAERTRLNREFVQGITATAVAPLGDNPGSCPEPYSAARAKKIAEPHLANRRNIGNASVGVLVDLDSTGEVTGTRVVLRSGTESIDDAVLDAAKHSTYEPATFLCRNIAGVYLMRIGMRTFSTITTVRGR